MGTRGDDDVLDLVADRLDFLEHLDGRRAYKPAIVDALGYSRSTVDRAIRALEAAGLVERTDGGFTTTLKGRLATEQYRETVAKSADVLAADAALEPLPSTAPLSTAAVTGAEVTVAEGPLDRPLDDLEAVLDRATRLFALVPTITDRQLLDRCRTGLVEGQLRAELVLAPALLDALADRFEDQLATMVEAGALGLRTGEVPAFGLFLAETDTGPVVVVTVYESDQTVHAVLTNETTTAIQWAKDVYRQYRQDATATTERFLPAEAEPPSVSITEIGRERTARSDDAATPRRASASDVDPETRRRLAEEGIEYLDAAYFEERAPGTPLTGWRTGFTLADVKAGHALARERPTDDGRTAVADVLMDRLRSGVDCALLGPPGTGKSTVLKRVAVRWHDQGNGPVFYREAGRGGALESTTLLEETLRATDGHALVVVEDGVRAAANAVFETMAALGDDRTVSFLLDARESEWDDPERFQFPLDARVRSYRREAVATVSMPSLDERETERFLAHFQAVGDVDIDVSAVDLYEQVTSEHGADEPAAVMLLVHRLTLLAEPGVTGDAPTSLTESVARTYRALADAPGELSLDLAVTVNLFNLVGVRVRPELLYGLALGGAYEDERVGEAIDRLKRRFVLRETEQVGGDGTIRYQPPHEAWSRLFLNTFIERAGERAVHGRLRRCLSIVCRLADDESLRETVRWQVAGTPAYLEEIRADPAGWVETLLRRVGDGIRRLPRLAAVLGHEGDLGVDLPTVVTWETEVRLLIERPATFEQADRAIDGYERAITIAREHRDEAPEQAARYEVRALLRQADAIWHQPERRTAAVERAAEIVAEAGLDDLDPEIERARAARSLSQEHIETYATRLEELSDERERERLDSLWELIEMRMLRHDYDGVLARLPEAFALADRIDDEMGELNLHDAILSNLIREYVIEYTEGPLGYGCGYPSDADWWSGSRRELLSVLGYDVEVPPGRSLQRACEELHQRATEIGDGRIVVNCCVALAMLACVDGRPDDADDYLDRAHQRVGEIEVPEMRASVFTLQGIVTALRDGDHDPDRPLKRAVRTTDMEGLREYVWEGLRGYVWTFRGLVAMEHGDEERLQKAYEAARDQSSGLATPYQLMLHERLAAMAAELGDIEAAIEHHEQGREAAVDLGQEAKARAYETARDQLVEHQQVRLDE